MKRLHWIVSVGTLGIMMASCSTTPTAQQTQPTAQSPTQTAQNPQDPKLLPVPAPPTAVTQAIAVPGMIQPVKGSQRSQKVAFNSQRDPFAQLPIAPIQVSAQTKTVSPGIKPTAQPNATKPAQVTTRPLSNPAPNPGNSTSFPPSAPLPLPSSASPVSRTALAEAVAIDGVVQVKGKASVIVRSPNETSRTVRVGEYIAGGKVLVKRIDMKQYGDPVVILEQNGVEVIKMVGNSVASAR
ncbi:MAG: hypothetical protein KME16_14430 [Scytolyngbya sp. HA4215-MV1]|nr:hypothetical protein [Scytolyngbya sp. HA4215-MV1]